MEDLNDHDTIQKIWNKGITVEGYNKDLYRQDFAGAWISRDAYGDRDSILGWEIDHVYPQSRGGGDELVNLRPMNWRNNLSKGDDYPKYNADITSKDNVNIEKTTTCTVNSKLQEILNKMYLK